MDTRPVLRLVDADDVPGSSRADPSLLAGPVVFPVAGLGEPGPGQSLQEHRETYGPRAALFDPRHGEDLVDLLAEVGVTGRGGGHFPAATKWRAVREATRRTGVLPLVVANGAEGEPASAKDAALLSRRPHLVLDGLADAAQTVGATESVLWLHGDAPALHRALGHALQERQAAGMREPSVRLVSGPGRYLSGESSAVVQALSGGPALPQFRTEPAALRGVHGRPTLVHNVETLARVGLLARTGALGHRPTSLVTVLAGGRRTVLEVAAGDRVRDAAALAGAPVGKDPQAVLIGGYGGSWLSWDEASGLELNELAMRRAGTSLGAGVLALLPSRACGIAETARVAAYLAQSGARQCGPCLYGLPAIARVVSDLQHGTARRSDIRKLQRWAGEVSGRGACHHPDGAVRMVLSALATFTDDVERHRKRHPCSGSVAPAVLPVPEPAT